MYFPSSLALNDIFLEKGEKFKTELKIKMDRTFLAIDAI